MLENSSLLLHPADAWGRGAICSPETSEPLGHAFWWSPGLDLPGRTSVQFHEHDDEPLLCTLHRPRVELPWYEVYDAQPHRVGRILGAVLLDREGRFFALCVPRFGDGTAVISLEGQVLAWFYQVEEGICLTFAPVVQGEPFVKMLLLAAGALATVDQRRPGPAS